MPSLPKHEFTITVSAPESTDINEALENLYEQGCNDSLIGFGRKGVLVLDFTRENKSIYEAIATAKREISLAIPESRIMSIKIGKVGMSDE